MPCVRLTSVVRVEGSASGGVACGGSSFSPPRLVPSAFPLLPQFASPMLQVDRILCPLDPGAASQPGLLQALFLASRFDAVLHVIPAPVCPPDASPLNSNEPPRPPGRAAASPRNADGVRTGLREAVAAAQTPETATVEVVVPDALLPAPTPAALVGYLDAQRIDLIVADTPDDRGPVPALASTPVRCLAEQARVPLFVVEHQHAPDAFRRILVPTDFSEHAREAMVHAKFLAALYGATIDVLHVLERPHYVALKPTDLLSMSDATLTERKARRRVESFYASCNGVDVPARLHVAHGDAADQIGHFVDEASVDLVVLSTHGAIGRPQRALGSVADKVLRRVTQPVFLTRAFGHSLLSAPRSQSDAPASRRPTRLPSSASGGPPPSRSAPAM